MKYTKENPLRIFEAFGGYGSQSLALKRIKQNYPDFDYKVVGYSDIEPAAITAYMALHEGEGIINYGDISKIDWVQVPDFDLFTMSSPCFTAGTLILTNEGYKKIEDIKKDDLVLTHTNSFQRVLKPMSRVYRGNMVYLQGMCFDDIYCTENHPFYVRRRYRKGHEVIRCFHEPEWIKAKNLDMNCYLGYAINQKSEMPKWNGSIDKRWGHDNQVNHLEPLFGKNEFWYIMGRYLGDGWKKESKNGNGIVISCSPRNQESLENALKEIGWNYCIVKERTANKIHVSMNELCSFVERYGYYAHGKKVDIDTMNLPVNLLESFIDGYMDSDGCVIGNINKTCSVSRELCFGMAQCVAKVYHRPFAIYRTKRPPQTIIEGRVVNQRDSYNLVWKKEDGVQDKAFYEDGYVWFPLSKHPLFIFKETEVYNMSVENDESYTANGAIVHNCQDFSNAGLQRGGEEGSGTRSSLLWECTKAIDIKRPKFIFFENVKGLVQAKFIQGFHKWQQRLEGMGYSNFAKVLDSKDFGVPQHRERIYMISIRKDGTEPRYHFPTPFPLEKCLADELSEDVGEEFFLSDEMLSRFCTKSLENE